jgi:transcription antitermination factor NusG
VTLRSYACSGKYVDTHIHNEVLIELEFMNRQWIALYTYPRHEKSVHQYLMQTDVESFLPLYTSVHRWKNGVKASVQLALFPGYVFAKMDPKDCGRVVRVPSVASIVSSRGIPLSMPTREIEALRTSVESLSLEPHPFVHVGAHVRVKNGPLTGLEGILIQKKTGYRFLLRMSLLMQAAAVEIDSCDVEPIGFAGNTIQFCTLEDRRQQHPAL